MQTFKQSSPGIRLGRCLGTTIVGIAAIVALVLVFESPEKARPRPTDPARERGSIVSAQVTTPLTPSAYLPLVTKNHWQAAPLWRFGVGQFRQPLDAYEAGDLVGLRLGWYIDWAVTPNAPRPYGIEYVPLVRVKQWKLADDLTWTNWCVDCPYVSPYTYTVSPTPNVIRAAALADPGMTWIIGNEIERIDWNGGRQDEILPQVYALAYYEIYTLIKSADPTAQVAIGGVIQATPLRLQYLDQVWAAYSQTYSQTMPVDAWNVHAFVLREERGSWGADIPAGSTVNTGILYSVDDNKNFAIAWQHIRAMRQWMKAKGQQNKPLIVSEYGVNMPAWMEGFSHQQVRDSFMYPSFDHFLNQTDASLGYPADNYRLVQRWNWYSLDDDNGRYDGGTYLQYFNGNLFYSGLGVGDQGISALGVYWKQYVQALPTGAAQPYPPAALPLSPPAAGLAGATEPAPTCAGQQIRLQFVEPSPPGSWTGLGEPAARESVICLPPSDH